MFRVAMIESYKHSERDTEQRNEPEKLVEILASGQF